MNRRDVLIFGSTAFAWPLTARAQQKAMPVIGYLSGVALAAMAPRLAAFHQGLNETGYVEGQNVAIEYRAGEGDYDRLAALAAELVGHSVNVIASSGGIDSALAAKTATATTPVVFVYGDDPVATGLIASLARPGGNLTGVSFLVVDLAPKLLELLSELASEAKAITLLVNPANSNAERIIKAVNEAAQAKGLQLRVLRASSTSEIDAAFAILAPHDGAIIVGPDPFFISRREQLVALAARIAVPAIYNSREVTEVGGLISYGPSLVEVYRQLGIYVGKILNGAKPADLPVQQPTRFELVINLKTARALGLTVPRTLLARADEVIE